VLNVGKVIYSTCFSITDGLVIPAVASAHDLGVIVSRDLSPSLHISNIVAKARKCTAAIYRAFRSRNADVLIIIIIIIIKGIYIAQVRKGHKGAMSAEMAVWLRNCLCLYS